MHNSIGLPCLEMTPDSRSALIGRNVGLERNDLRDRLNGSQINTYDQAVLRCSFRCYLAPGLPYMLDRNDLKLVIGGMHYSRRCAKIENDLALLCRVY